MQRDDAYRAVLELAASQYGAFSRRQAAEREINARQLRREVEKGRLLRPLPDAFLVTGSAQSWRQSLMVQTLQGHAVASHRAAAALHGFDGFRPGVVEVCVPRNRESLERDAIVHGWRRTDEEDLVFVEGIRCTSRARTLVQLGAVVGRHRVEQALDSALRDGLSASSIENRLIELWRPGRTGAGVLRGLIEDPRRSGALPDSWFERLVQQVLEAPGLPRPDLQYEVRLESGVRRLDLAYPDVKLGVEAHSRRFHFGPSRIEADNERDLELAAAGWEVVYVTWSMAHEPHVLAGRLQAVYDARSRLVS